ncbi:MAG: PEP-CTERM sorting domain-containing protein [Deltaproteobacteria bacterium]|nr:PEP-CTERM sorting domain-containing protein [Deltaproteobacteria bacterium]
MNGIQSIKHIPHVLLGLAILALGATSASAQQTLVQYGTANTTSLAPAVVDPSVTASNLGAGSGLGLNTGSTFNFNSWNITSTSFENALAADDVWTWDFSVADPNALVDLATLDIRLDRSTQGPDDFEIRASINGGASTSILIGDFAGGSVGVNYLGVDLSSLAGLTFGDSVRFTLAAWNATSALGTFDLETITFPGGTDGLTIRGNVSVIPEPSTTLLFALGLGGLASIRRREANVQR